jgi:ElaB/YqjD/DUF883 family membrane-anchored ribosome-binding protein
MATTTNAKTAKPRKPAAAKAAETPAAKERFAKALEEAKAGAEALTKEAQAKATELGKEAQARAGAYREKATAQSSEWIDEAKELGGQAKEKAYVLANDGKAKASEAISGLGKIVDENASIIDEKVGPKYGEYARSAAKSMQDAAAKLDKKDLGELGEDAKDFVRKSPGAAVAIAAVAGFVLARMFKKSDD